jgi:hypothetical protein
MDQNNNDHRVKKETGAGTSDKEELLTLFASGLPQDMKQREFNLLFNDFKGYEGAIIKQPSRSAKNVQPGQIQQPQGPVAFITFATRRDAELAKEKFQGYRLNTEQPHLTLKLEFAKANTKSRYRSRESSSNQNNFFAENSQIVQTVTFAPLQQPFPIDPTGFMQGDIGGQHMCWPMCWSLPYPTHEQFAYPEGFHPIPVDNNPNLALQPILFPTDQLAPFPQHEPPSPFSRCPPRL